MQNVQLLMQASPMVWYGRRWAVHIDHVYWKNDDHVWKEPHLELYCPYYSDHDASLVTLERKGKISDYFVVIICLFFSAEEQGTDNQGSSYPKLL